MHHIIVFGGQGRTGREVVLQALEAGHNVTVFTYKNNGTLPESAKLRIIEGNARSAQAVADAIAGHDIVINIIAPRLFNKKNYDISVVATKNIIKGMKQHGVSRYFGQCGAWATENVSDASLPMRIGFIFFIPLRQVYKYKKLEDQVVQKSGLKWTIVRAALLTNGPLAWPIHAYPNGYKCRFYELPHISRKSVAKYYVSNLDNSDIVHKYPVVIE